MLDLKRLRQDPERVRDQLVRKGFSLDVDQFQELEGERRRLQTATESLQQARNERSKSIGAAKARGEDIAPLLAEVGNLGEQLDAAKSAFNELSERLQEFLLAIPQIPDASVPEGTTEDDNQQLRVWGEQPKFNFEPKDHVDIGEPGGMDFAAAANLSGARFVVLRGVLARLQRALTQMMLDIHRDEHGYQEVYVPYLVGEEALYGTGQLPKFRDDQFRMEGEHGLFLIATAEVPVTNLYRDQILSVEELPVKHVCHSPCFRAEAGSHGKDTRGMIRQHQFEKVELVQVVHPDKSWEALEELTSHAEAILQRLELPYRTVALCGGDLGFAAAKTLDLEVWLPGQQAYREISSCSNFLDFQARRLQARFRNPETGKPEPVHTVNGSGLAVGRTMVAVLENYQDGAGNVAVPDALREYMGGMTTLELGT